MSPVLDNDFTNWDDPAYVSENDLIRDPSPMGLWRIVTAIQVGNYHPVTLLSYVVDHRLSASDVRGYHRTNLILHILCTLAEVGGNHRLAAEKLGIHRPSLTRLVAKLGIQSSGDGERD